MKISASVLSVENVKATQTFYNLEVAGNEYFHIDVMDGKFVKNNTSEIMKDYSLTIKHISQIPLDVHLMVNDVKEYINEYIDLKPDFITFHYEAIKDKKEIMNNINLIKNNGIRAGISIKPNTDISEILEYLPYISLVLVMSVEPGYGGQEFISNSLDKIRNLREYLDKNNLEVDIEVDGGINDNTFKLIKEAGADIAVIGSYLINSKNYVETIKNLKEK